MLKGKVCDGTLGSALLGGGIPVGKSRGLRRDLRCAPGGVARHK